MQGLYILAMGEEITDITGHNLEILHQCKPFGTIIHKQYYQSNKKCFDIRMHHLNDDWKDIGIREQLILKDYENMIE